MTDDVRPPAEATRIDPQHLELLVCPLTKGRLDYDAERQELISREAKLAYPIRDGIPIMLPEEARPLEYPLPLLTFSGARGGYPRAMMASASATVRRAMSA